MVTRLERLRAATAKAAEKGLFKGPLRPAPTYLGIMPSPFKPREQGDLGELSAMEWLASQGAHIYLPLGHSPDDRELRQPPPAGPGEDVHPRERARSLGGSHQHDGREPELERPRQVLRCETVRLPLRAGGRRTPVVHSHSCIGMQVRSHTRRAEILRIRDRARAGVDRGREQRRSRIGARSGGVSKRSKDGGCKPSGSAFAGSNPASPIARRPERADAYFEESSDHDPEGSLPGGRIASR
jgi:hypothetical protein